MVKGEEVEGWKGGGRGVVKGEEMEGWMGGGSGRVEGWRKWEGEWVFREHRWKG